MCNKCFGAFLAAIIIVFAFWKTAVSEWIIVIAAAIILVYHLTKLFDEGCSWKKSGSNLFMEKGSDELHEGPTRKELSETLKKKQGNMPMKKKNPKKK